MVARVALLNTFELFDITSEAFFFTAKCAKKEQPKLINKITLPLDKGVFMLYLCRA